MRAAAIVNLIVGEELAEQPTHVQSNVSGDAAVLSVHDLRGKKIHDLSFALRRGEVLGVAGLVGCGRSELLRVLAGAQRPAGGALTLDERPLALASPADAVRAGITYVPQDRPHAGVVREMTTAENLTLGRLYQYQRGPMISRRRETRAIATLIAHYHVKTQSPGAKIRSLSGGNQQKVVVARAASSSPRVLLLDEPTQGVDAHAKQEIYQTISMLSAEGLGVIVGSSDNEELVRLCDRVLVLNRGAHVSTLSAPNITELELAHACSVGSVAGSGRLPTKDARASGQEEKP
jgi:ribose transport system ATP-binding protein